MLYNKIIFFLGFYSWSYLPINKFEKYFNYKYINTLPNPPLNNNKKLINYLQNNSISPNFNLYIPEIFAEKMSNNDKIKFYFYQFYSFLIFLLLLIQPIYLLIKSIIDNNNFPDYFISFLCHINTPINYIWAKYYYKNNHYIKFCNQSSESNKKSDKLLISLFISSILSIFINLFYYESFLNKYNCYYYLNNTYLIYFFSLLEWIYARFLYSLTTCSATIIFCFHTNELNNFKNKIEKNEFKMENNYCLTKIISHIAKLRHSIELSINFYNKIISFITITSTLSLSLYISHKTNNLINFKIKSNDIYLLQTYLLFLLFQLVFFINIYRYNLIREDLAKLLQGPSFINQFLTRWSISKIKNKLIYNSNTDNDKRLNEILSNTKILLCIDEENATTIDWFVLEKLINIKWMDFSIMGITFNDIETIKKIMALSSILLIFFGYL